ncbi:hypothetical protein vseg_007439 [Gypsophila vaccaria]
MDAPHAPPLSTPPPLTTTTSPPITTTTTTNTPTTLASPYTDSIDSSPHSRATDFDDAPPATTTPKLRLMCSYGGHIVPRPHTKSLCYVGGDTRMVVVDRTSTLSDLLNRLSKTIYTTTHHQKPFTLKYQLPNEDLDSLITVSTDEDLDNMIDEYDRLNSSGGKPGRIRLFLFPVRPEGAQSMGPILDGSNRSEDWFLNALNGTSELHRGFSDPNSVNCLLGLDHDVEIVNPNYSILGSDGNSNSNNNSNNNSSNNINNHINNNINNGGNLKGELVMEGLGGKKLGNLSAQDVQSVPDSPIVETTSSFGSTSSSPSLGNLPQIRVHADEGSGRGMDQRVGGGGGGTGIEEQFAQMGVGSGNGGGGGGGTQLQKVIEEGFMVISSPSSVAAGGGGSEFGSRVYLDDVGFGKQQQMGQGVMNLHAQQKQQLGGGELPSPDSVSSDSSLSGAITRQKPVMYQDTNGQLSSGSNMFPPGIPVHQVPESGYTLLPQSDQVRQLIAQRHQNQQFLQQYHPQQQTQTQPQTQPQYIPAGQHFVHHHPPGAVPVPAYYQVYPSQQPHNHPHQYPVYYVPAGPAQGYSLPGQQQPNMVEAPTSVPSNRTQAPPNPTIITNSTYNPTRNMNLQPLNSELGPAVYGTTTGGGGPQLVQVPSSLHQPSSQSQSQLQPQPQHQYLGYSHIHHPPQSVAPSTGAGSTYAYEFADPAHPKVFYTQPLAPVSAPAQASQYQGMASAGPTMMMPEGSSQLSNDSAKQQT